MSQRLSNHPAICTGSMKSVLTWKFQPETVRKVWACLKLIIFPSPYVLPSFWGSIEPMFHTLELSIVGKLTNRWEFSGGVISLKSNVWEIKSGYYFLSKKWEHFINPSPKPSKVLAFHHIAPKPKQKSSNSFHVMKTLHWFFFHVIEPRLVVDLKKPEKKKVAIFFWVSPQTHLAGSLDKIFQRVDLRLASNGTESTKDVKKMGMDVFVSNPATYPVILRILGLFSRKIHISLGTIIVYHRAGRIFGCFFQEIQYRVTLRNFCLSTLLQVLPLRKAFLHCWHQKGALRSNFKSFSEIVRYDVFLWGTFTERRWLALSLSPPKWEVDLPKSGSHPKQKKNFW